MDEIQTAEPKTWSELPDWLTELWNINSSLVRKAEADRAARAPLIEALEKIAQLSNEDGDNGEHRDIARAALASVKE